MKTYLSRRIPVVVAAGVALAMLAMGFLAALGVRSLVGTASADPAGPVPAPVGHAWTELQGHGVDGNGVYVDTTADQALELKVNSARALRLEPNATSPNVIGGYGDNSVTSGAYGASIGGGGGSGAANGVTDLYGTVAGGYGNQAGDNAGATSDRRYATVGGGSGNTASGEYATVGGGGGNTASGYLSTVGGGNGNTASEPWATVGGGVTNTASGWLATVGGGQDNTASGGYTAVPGGRDNIASNDYATVGGGDSNTASGPYATVGGGVKNTASGNTATIGGGEWNSASHNYATVCGGVTNTASGMRSTIGGGYGNSASNDYATVDGGEGNAATAGYATVGGGQSNAASAAYATIAGGGRSDPAIPATGNRVTDDYGTVGGGGNNQAGDNAGSSSDRPYATVAGGQWNTASGYRAAVGGGHDNTASGDAATVGGGAYNTASGEGATVPGGESNLAAGTVSLAAGFHANADYDGCFVWGDYSTVNYVTCYGANRFIARASGGVFLFSNASLTSGVALPPGSSSWASMSSRDVKDNFTPVDGQQVLASLAQIPITTWNYKAQDASIRHMGPMAQDFYAAFQVGEDDKHITTVDADGVALAAIQGLYQLSQEQAARIQALEEENAALQQRLDGLEARVSALEGNGTNAAVSQASSSGLPMTWVLPGCGLAVVLVGLMLARRRLAGGRR